MAFRDRIKRSRERFSERVNIIFRRGPKLDEEFWDDLEETLILSDLGGSASDQVIENLREQATRKALPDAYAVLDLLADEIEGLFAPTDNDPFRLNPVCVLFVGVNGAGKTTTVGKLAYQASAAGRKVLIGSADTFRAAAIEQLDVWGERSGVEVIKRERGADPASVCYDVMERAEQLQSDLVLIDTSGRLHTSDELMRELQKVVNVTRKRADIDVKTVLVIDATTGQNGLQQAREFNKALSLDGVIMTKLDGTAKGGIAVAISHELGLPICRVGVGEGIEDLEEGRGAVGACYRRADCRAGAGTRARARARTGAGSRVRARASTRARYSLRSRRRGACRSAATRRRCRCRIRARARCGARIRARCRGGPRARGRAAGKRDVPPENAPLVLVGECIYVRQPI